MRLIFVTGSLVHGGAERHSITLVNRLAERGHECHAVYVKNDPSQLERLRAGPGGSVGTVRCLEAARYFDPRAIRDFAAQLAALRPAVIVAANPYALMYASLARALARLPARVLVTFHTTQLLSAKEWLQMLAYRGFFWSSDCAVFVCEKQRAYWRRRGVFAQRNEVIYNGVDTEHFQPAAGAAYAAERTALRAAQGFAGSDYVIGISAVLRPEKNHVQLVEAVAQLRANGIPARALLIGDGPTRGDVEARARALGVSDSVRITGFQQEIRPYVSACDTMLLCSVAVETFSLAALEAMALGKPVVHSDIGGASEMVFSGTNGFLFPAGDTPALTERLAALADRTIAAHMGAAARDITEQRFSEDAMVARYERLLHELQQRDAPRQARASQITPVTSTPERGK